MMAAVVIPIFTREQIARHIAEAIMADETVTYQTLALEWGVSPATVSRIVRQMVSGKQY